MACQGQPQHRLTSPHIAQFVNLLPGADRPVGAERQRFETARLFASATAAPSQIAARRQVGPMAALRLCNASFTSP